MAIITNNNNIICGFISKPTTIKTATNPTTNPTTITTAINPTTNPTTITTATNPTTNPTTITTATNPTTNPTTITTATNPTTNPTTITTATNPTTITTATNPTTITTATTVTTKTTTITTATTVTTKTTIITTAQHQYCTNYASQTNSLNNSMAFDKNSSFESKLKFLTKIIENNALNCCMNCGTACYAYTFTHSDGSCLLYTPVTSLSPEDTVLVASNSLYFNRNYASGYFMHL